MRGFQGRRWRDWLPRHLAVIVRLMMTTVIIVISIIINLGFLAGKVDFLAGKVDFLAGKLRI